MEPASFNITVHTDFWNSYRATRALWHRRWTVWLFYILAIDVAAAWVINLVVHGPDKSPPGTLDRFGLLPVVAILGVVFVLFPLLQMYQVWALCGSNPRLAGERHFTYGPEGIFVRSAVSQVSMKWEAIPKAIETKRHFFIYFTARAAHYIPKAQISSFPELEQLRGVLKTYLGDKARLRADGLN